MYINEIDGKTFNSFAKTHILNNYFQCEEYGNLMENSEYKVMYVGFYNNAVLRGASLILYKEILSKIKYGYAPRGFLIDYNDKELIKSFTDNIKNFFYTKGFAFIKINPEITYAKLDFENKCKYLNKNNENLMKYLKNLGYQKLKNNLYFESLLPKYSPIIDLHEFDSNKLDENVTNIYIESKLKGYSLVLGSKDNIKDFYKFIENKNYKTLSYYECLYDSYKVSNMVDYLFVEVNYALYLTYLQRKNIILETESEKINKDFNNNPYNSQLYNKKTDLDNELNKLSYTIAKINNKIKENGNKEFLGSALVIKNNNRATIIISGAEDKEIKTFLFYEIINKYKNDNYHFLDLYGITGDFTDKNPYKKLNDFKLQFNPTVYEYIGEFDLIINKTLHKMLWSTNKLQKEFYRPAIIKK